LLKSQTFERRIAIFYNSGKPVSRPIGINRNRCYASTMHELDRVKLLGKYRTPRFRYGAVVTCAIRGKVKIVALTDGRIPWPKCQMPNGPLAIILYGALADAVRRESVEAIKYWFGV
jgi:hypothetical protein